ncbi:MAG: ABC transporter permease subunit [Spirochaetales bacterium]|nr:ABC transporter permease subunit [Spirochaetales bacterium]
MSSGTKIYLGLAPILLPAAILVAGGFTVTLLQSLSMYMPGIEQGPRLSAYIQLFKNSWYTQSFVYSIFVGFCSALLSVAIGTAMGYWLWRLPLSLQKPAIVYKIPLVLPHLAVAFLTLIFFSRSGLVSSFANKLGLTTLQSEFPRILFGGNGLGLIIAYTYKEIPFVILMTLSVYKRIDERLIVSAVMLGAKRITVFRRIVLPFVLPVMSTSFIILFLYAFGGFDIPFLLSESRPQMVSIFVYNTYFKRDLVRRPEAMAALVIMFIFAVVFIAIYSRIVSTLGEKRRLP